MTLVLLLLSIPFDHGDAASPWFYVNIALAVLFVAQVIYLLLRKSKPILEEDEVNKE